MADQEQVVEAPKAKKAKKAKIATESVPVAAKVLLQIASQKPKAELDTGTEKVIVPTAVKNGVNKRALAVALYETACEVLGVAEPDNSMAKRLAALAFVHAGGAFCHGSGTALKGEVKEEKGASGYINTTSPWWAKLIGDNHNKVNELLPFAKSVFAVKGKVASVEGTTEQKFASLEANLKG